MFQAVEQILFREARFVHISGKMVAMQTRCRARIHGKIGEKFRQPLQNLISFLLAEKLVDQFKILDVRTDDAAFPLHAIVKLLAHSVVEALAVIKSRELVA